jgi:hypothetical protein
LAASWQTSTESVRRIETQVAGSLSSSLVVLFESEASKGGEEMITLEQPPYKEDRKVSQGVIACHDPIDHWLNNLCIHIELWKKHMKRTTTQVTVAILTLEIIHCVLPNFGEEYDRTWEDRHGRLHEARELLNSRYWQGVR